MELNEQQKRALAACLRLAGTRRQACLVGYAGTGKTTTLRALVEALRNIGYRPKVTAPTHKAVAVAGETLACESDTIHRTLGLSVGTKDDGEQVSRGGGHFYETFDFLIVDEASMIDEDMFGIVCEKQRDSLRDWPVLWVGDPAQLPPVRGEDVSPVWRIEEQHRLTQIMRQAESSGIIPLSLVLRECLERGQRPTVEALRAASQGAVDVEWTTGGAIAAARALIERLNLGDQSFSVAWTNDRVADIEKATLARLGRPARYQVGDEVIFGSQYRRSIKNSARGFVIEIQPAESFYGLQTEDVTLELAHGEEVVRAAVDWGLRLKMLGMIQSKVAHLNKHEPKSQNHKEMLGLLMWARLSIADIRVVFATTAHKSQGSTVDSVVVDVGNMMRCRKDAELAQLLYVAVTRARKHVVMVE